MSLHPNKIIQNYQVSHLLGSGGMGEVWAGRHMYMDRNVAIKALHSSLVSNAEIRVRFKNEAVTMSQLDHPNIVRLYDYIEAEDGVYLVMEFVDGDPLDDYILRKTGPIPEAAAQQLFVQMLAGLQYAHNAGVIHRDIKPSNFMVTRDLRVKILDFGIAKLLESHGGDRTKSGARIGTVLYMSPEQVKGLALDGRSDIYAMGVTLFQMVTGRCPYSAQDSEYEVYQRIINEPLPRALTFYPAVSSRIQLLIDKATAKRPIDRFQNCTDFSTALQGGAMAENQPSATPQRPVVASVPKAVPTKRKSRLHWSLKLGFWLIVLSGLGTASFVWGWPILQKELQEIQERTPDVVANEFLMALERNDLNFAAHLGNPECRDELLIYTRGKRAGRRRAVEVLKTETLGIRSTIEYHYDKENRRHSIQLRRRMGMWEVDCRQEDLW